MFNPIAQFVYESVLTGSIYLLFSLGLTMTYGILKFPNVAHGEFFTIGAFTTYIVSAGLQTKLPQAVIIGALFGGLVGVISYLLIFRTLIKRGAGLIPLTVASIGWSLLLRYLINFYFSGIYLYNFTYLPFNLFGIFSANQISDFTIVSAFVLAGLFHILLTYTKLGKAIRATANNPTLALASGINTEFVIVVVWFIGSAMAGLAGALQGIASGLTSTMGFEIIITAFAVVVLGGIGSFYGSILSSLLLAFATNAAIYFIFYLSDLPPIHIAGLVVQFVDLNPDYSFVVAFLILAVTLVFLPEGLGSLRKESFTRLFQRRKKTASETEGDVTSSKTIPVSSTDIQKELPD